MNTIDNAHIRRPLRGMIIFFFAVALLSVGWYGYHEYRTAVDNATQGIANDSRMLAEHAARTFGEVSVVLLAAQEILAQTLDNRLDNEKQIHDFLQSRNRKLPDVSAFFIVGPTGRLFASTSGYPVRQVDVTDRDYFSHHQSVATDVPFVSKPFKSRLSNKWIVTVTSRLNLPDGTFGGVVGATLELGYFDDVYQGLFGHSYRHISLVRRDGIKIVVVPPAGRNFENNKSLGETELLSQLRRNRSGTFRSKDSIDAVDSLIGYASLPGDFPLVAVVEAHWSDILRPWLKWTTEQLFLVIFLMVPLVFLYRRLVSRLAIDQQQSEEISLLSRIVEQSPVSIVITDKEGTLSYVNDRFCELTGYSRDEALGQNPRVLKSDLTPPETFADMWRNLAAGIEWRGELCNKKKDGTLYWEMAYIFPVMNSDGELSHFAGIKENITQRKEVEQELENARHVAEEANRAKSLFLATMSHEIRTPLNAILGMTYLAMQSGLYPAQQSYLEKVTEAAKSLLAIINDILDFSKIEAGKMTLEALPVRLDELLEGISAIIRVAADEKGLPFICAIEPDVPLTIVGDPVRLRQILLNLASNAVKFTKSGQVRLSISVSPGRNCPDGMAALTFAVADTGIGMSSDQLERIFAPFSQADSSISRRYGGTGLGLSIVKRLVEKMGSTLEVVSTPGEGSIFSFTILTQVCCMLAYESDGTGEQADSAGTIAGLAGARVLLMEDNQINLLVAREMLRRFNIEVVTADNGRQGCDLIFGGTQFDLVITDVQMPEMDGCEAAALIRTRYDTQQLPIIAMTGFVLDDELKQILASGINDCLAKPIDPEELQRLLLKWLKPDTHGDYSTRGVVADAAGQSGSVMVDSLPGFNLKEAYNRLGDDGSMLVTLIRNAATELREAVTRVSDLVQQRPIDRKTLLFELHSLAGSSANIGAETIARAARDLEFHFKRGASEPSAALQQAYEDAAREFLDSLAQITVLSEERAVQHGSSVDPAERASLARQLYGQLKGNRGSSLQTCYAMRELFAGVSDMDKLERQVKRFDFKNAMATLKDIAVMSGITLEE